MGKYSGFLLASDVDGTLLPHDGVISGRVRPAIEQFIDEGGLFTVVTGRTRMAMEVLRPHVPMNAPAVLGNGALLYDYQNQKLLHRRCLDGGYIKIVQEIAEAFPDVSIEAHAENGLWVLHPNEGTEKHFELIGVRGEIIDDLSVPPQPWLKAVFVSSAERLASVRKLIKNHDCSGYSLVSAIVYYLELLHRDANKGTGVARLAEMMGIAPERTFVIGDGNNDLPMITRFNSFAPSNADDEVKNAAQRVVCSAEDGAVAEAIELLLV